jgi:predicted amidophosphoribosyltransferase
MKTLVVDDIFVTGATINSASRAIKKAGGQSVFAITVARSLLNTPA